MVKRALPKAPKGLSREARAVWARYTEVYEFDPPSLTHLQALCEWYDRRLEARAQIAREGITVKDRFGQAKANPACVVERDASAMVLRHAKYLGVDLEPISGR